MIPEWIKRMIRGSKQVIEVSVDYVHISDETEFSAYISDLEREALSKLTPEYSDLT